MRTTKLTLATLFVALFAAPSIADTIVDYPLDADAGFGWGSNSGSNQQVAETFTSGTNTTAGTVSWYGFWDTDFGPVNDVFSIHFFDDVGGTPDSVAFASETISGIFGAATGLDNGSGDAIFEFTTQITGVSLAADNYWISIQGLGPNLSFVWSHSASDGSGNVFGRFSDGEDWQSFGAGGRDLQTLRIESVPEPGTLALLGIGLLGMGAARRRKII